MNISRNGSRASNPVPKENFTGDARLEPMFSVGDPIRVRSGCVTFQPGARNQLAHAPQGPDHHHHGRIPVWCRSGAVRSAASTRATSSSSRPAEKHWHGASPTNAMTHIAIVEHDENGKSADWMEPVTDAQYGGPIQND